MQISFIPHFRMKHAVLFFFITPLCGIISALMLVLSIPDLLANQYKLTLSLESFYYSSSQWKLVAQNIQSSHPPIEIPLTLRHGPWLGSTQLGLLSLKSQSVPNSSKNDLQASLNAIGTLSYSISLENPRDQFPEFMQGSINIFTHRSECSLQGSFPLYFSQLSNSQIHFIYEKSLFGTSSISLTAEIERLTNSHPDRSIEIHNLKIDLIPSFGSWRGSLLGSLHADLWSEAELKLPELSIELAVLNAKTKRLADCLNLAYRSLPLGSADPRTISVTQYQRPEDFLDLIDLVDPDWATLTLSSLHNSWLLRAFHAGESVQIDAQGVGTQLYTLWATLFPSALLSNLADPSSLIKNWADETQYINLSSYNFQSASWTPATDPGLARPLADS